ncbi:MAG: alpha-2-macroglobulin family protein, partial [Haloferula sp.]
MSLDEEGKVLEELVKEWKARSGESGEGEHEFKAPTAGQYRLSVKLKDAKGNEEEGATVFVVRGAKDKGQGLRFNDLELVLDKKHYEPGESARVLINTNQADSTVLLFLRGSGNVAEELEIIRMDGKSHEYELKLEKRDMPNTFIEAVTIARGQVITKVKELVLPPEKRLLSVEVVPEKTKYKPREKGKVTIRLMDEHGEPFVGSTAITVYDKSLEYISGGSNVPEIKSVFWNWKRSYSRGALGHSQILGGHGLAKAGSIRMQSLGRFGSMVVNFNSAGVYLSGGAGGGGREFRMKAGRANSLSLDVAGALSDSVPMPAAAMEEAQQGGGLDGGNVKAPEVMVRSEFADLVKWAGSVETNEQGEAVIDLEMPDNLTTWKIKTWAVGHGTRVGEGSAEIITSKDLIVRLQAPRFFIESDEVTLSAIVHNYHEEAKEVSVSLELEGGTVVAEGSTQSSVVIPAGGEKRINWTAVARQEGEVTIRMKAIGKDDADAMEMKFPVYVHGMARTESWSRGLASDQTSATIKFEVPEKRRPNETRLEIRYSPTIATAMVDALPYLASYPYGCTEQTLNRFVPTVITQKILKEMEVDLSAVRNKRVNLNPQEIGDAKERAAQWQQWKENPVWDEKEVAKMVRAGIQRLQEMQNGDGGWGWFSAYGEKSYPHTTAVVVNGLILARDNGAEVPGKMLQSGIKWLKKYEASEAEKIRLWKKRKHNTKEKAGAMDAMVREILGRADVAHEEMLGFLMRDKVSLPVYAKCLLGLELHRVERIEDRDAVLKNVEQ